MTLLISAPSSFGDGWSFNTTQRPAHLPSTCRLSITRPRPLSVASSNSAGAYDRRSFVSSGSSGVGGEELKWRAREALRASKSTRIEIEERRNSRSFVTIAATTKTTISDFAFTPNSVNMRSNHPEFPRPRMSGVDRPRYDSVAGCSSLDQSRKRTTSEWMKGPSPRKVLKKSRSIPLSLLNTPSSSTDSPLSSSHSPTRHREPRRVASYNFLRSSPPPRHSYEHTFRPLPLHLPLPADKQLTSKFSNSTGGSDDSVEAWRKRSRTLSHAASLKNLLVRTTTSLSVSGSPSGTPQKTKASSTRMKSKASLATLFSTMESPQEDPATLAGISSASTHNSSPSTSTIASSSYTHKTGRTSKSVGGGFRAAFRDLTNSRSKVSSESSRHQHNRAGSDYSSDVSGGSKKSWVSKIGRAVSGKKMETKRQKSQEGEKRHIQSPEPVVHFAERVNLTKTLEPITQQKLPPSRLPSRIPISAVFPNVVPIPRPVPKQQASKISEASTVAHRKSFTSSVPLKIKPTSQRSFNVLTDSNVQKDGTIRCTKSKVTTEQRQRTVGRPKPKMTPPEGTVRLSKLPRAPTSTFRHAPTTIDNAAASVNLDLCPAPVLLSPMRLRPSEVPGPAAPPSTSDSDDAGPALNATPPLRSTSPARFRDLLPSPSAASSPDRNHMDLPRPEDSPKGVHQTSPKKLAMGPEQVIGMEGSFRDSKALEGLQVVAGVTSDLAELLSGLTDETTDLTKSDIGASNRRVDPRATSCEHLDLSNSLRQCLPKIESIESLRSTVSDVPDDLQMLIQSVSDHISEVELNFYDSDGQRDGGIEEEFEIEQTLDFEITADYGEPAGLFVDVFQNSSNCSTVSSFEGHATTAAATLQSMLKGPAPNHPQLYEEDVNERTMMRDSVQEYLSTERPTVSVLTHHILAIDPFLIFSFMMQIGEKMMVCVDIEVSLASLVNEHSPPPWPKMSCVATRHSTMHKRTESRDSTSGSSAWSSSSPTPANYLRRSISRYSADSDRRYCRTKASIQSDRSSFESDHDRPPAPHAEDQTSVSIAQSTRSTDLSISSANSSPCPAPQQRRIPMLTRHIVPTPPFLISTSKANATIKAPKKDSFSTKSMPWTQSISQVTSKGDSPFKKKFNPLDQFRANKMIESGSEGDLSDSVAQTSNGSQNSSPRFVRSLHPPKEGEGVPRPRPLSLTNSLIPPDTPPPSSPSASEASEGSACSSICTYRLSIEGGHPSAPPPIVTRRHSKGHSRQISLASTILQDVIVEEHESPLTSPTAPVRTVSVNATVKPYILDIIDEPTLVTETIVSEDDEDDSADEVLLPSQIPPPTQTFQIEIGAPSSPGDVLPEDVEDEEEFVKYENNLKDSSFIPTLEEERSHELNRRWLYFCFEAESELRRSLALWPDTEKTRELLASEVVPSWRAFFQPLTRCSPGFIPPTNVCDVLNFLLDSQDRFRGKCLPRSLSAIDPIVNNNMEWREDNEIDVPRQPSSEPSENEYDSEDDQILPANISVSPPSPEPLPFISARIPLATMPLNHQLLFTKSIKQPSQGDTDALSPFTALPPRLGLKLRTLRANGSPKKRVDVSFLGTQASKRRKEQFDAARRRLEGVGTPDEQRSDEESSEDVSDRSGEFEGAGESDGSPGFCRWVGSVLLEGGM